MAISRAQSRVYSDDAVLGKSHRCAGIERVVVAGLAYGGRGRADDSATLSHSGGIVGSGRGAIARSGIAADAGVCAPVNRPSATVVAGVAAI